MTRLLPIAAALVALCLVSIPVAAADTPWQHVDDLNNGTSGCVHLGGTLVTCGDVLRRPRRAGAP